ncbi:aminotransferase class V-fold PLP-dependent enzyme [Candidatus Pelagibacter sp.]|nr:aminotransferase class V-fold PLP-dependent enzyme [Candidatus Pelagibacter sp.]
MTPLFKVFMPKNIHSKLKKTIKTGYLSEGIKSKIFQKKVSKFIGNNKVTLTNSCTSALTMAYKIIDVKNAEVISTPLTCVAANVPLIHQGAKIVWSDIDQETGMVTADNIEKCITDKTKAISILHKDGQPANILPILKLAKKYKIKIVEDAAHAFGASLNGLKIGNFGDYTAFSFQAIKQINTGDGGALVCKSSHDYQISKKLKWLGIDRENKLKKNIWLNDIKIAGYKFNINDMTSTIGIEQMKFVNQILKKNNENGIFFDNELKKIKGIDIVKRQKNEFNTFWTYTLLSNKKKLIESHLNKNNVQCFQVHPRNDNYSIFKKYKKKLPNLDKFSKRELNIPCGWWLTKIERERILKLIKESLN